MSDKERAFELIEQYKISQEYIEHNTYEDYLQDFWHSHTPIDSNDEYQLNKQIMCRADYEFLEKMYCYERTCTGDRIMKLTEIIEQLNSLKNEMNDLFEKLYEEQKEIDSEEQEERWCELDNQIDSLGEALSCIEEALNTMDTVRI